MEEGLQRVSHVVQIVKPPEATCAFGLYEYLTWLIWSFESDSDDKLPYCLFQNKIEGTIWKEIDDLKVFKVMDLEEFQQTFSAYQKPQVPSDTLILSVSHSCHTFISNNDTDFNARFSTTVLQSHELLLYCLLSLCNMFLCINRRVLRMTIHLPRKSRSCQWSMVGEHRTVTFCSHGQCENTCVKMYWDKSKNLLWVNCTCNHFQTDFKMTVQQGKNHSRAHVTHLLRKNKQKTWYGNVCYRLKLTNEEIRHAILTMDEQEDLPKDMLEQVGGQTLSFLRPCPHIPKQSLFPPVFLGIVSRIFASTRIHWKRLKTL